MTKDEEIKKGLAAAGIPRYAFSTTLPSLGQRDIREDIKRKVFVGTEPRGAWVYSLPHNANVCRTVFCCMAKELYLSGVTVYCIPLFRLVEMLRSEEGVSDQVERCQVLFILDAYESQGGQPFDAETMARLRYMIRDRFDAGKAVCMHSDAPLTEADWWPPAMRSYLTARCNNYQVEATE